MWGGRAGEGERERERGRADAEGGYSVVSRLHSKAQQVSGRTGCRFFGAWVIKGVRRTHLDIVTVVPGLLGIEAALAALVLAPDTWAPRRRVAASGPVERDRGQHQRPSKGTNKTRKREDAGAHVFLSLRGSLISTTTTRFLLWLEDDGFLCVGVGVCSESGTGSS